jgi:hypothetical protein
VVPEREQKLILDLLLGKISEEGFCREFPTSPREASSVALSMLRQALRERDAVGVEFGLYLGHRFGISQDFLDVLLSLSNEPWHQQHENVIDGLAKLADPASVDVLYQTALARHPYLEYDEAFALGTKSIHALGAIRTPEAIARLGDLLHSGNEILESKAESQLRRIERADAPDFIRDAARKVLAAGH